jgi:hypothetical protein
MCSKDVGGVLDQSYSDDLSFADLFKQMASKQVLGPVRLSGGVGDP